MLVYTKKLNFLNLDGFLKADSANYKNETINYPWTKSVSEKIQHARLKWAFFSLMAYPLFYSPDGI